MGAAEDALAGCPTVRDEDEAEPNSGESLAMLPATLPNYEKAVEA